MTKWYSLSVLFILSLLCISWNNINSSSSEILDFIVNNPSKSAIKLIYNGEAVVELNGDKKTPIASTVKLVIAIEYAKQSASNIIDPEELIHLDSLNKFFIPFTDGGAHPAWLKYAEEDIVENQISLANIAKGMIVFSSNANTEYLLRKLGLQNINNSLKELKIKDHDPLFYIVSAIFVPKYVFPNITNNDSIANALRNLTHEQYRQACEEIHTLLNTDSNYKNEVGNLSFPVQQAWSERLPGSTVNEYAKLMDKISSRSYFSKDVYKYLDPVLEIMLENPANREWIEHCGDKGGSTASILTRAIYVNTKAGNRISIAYFFNDLNFVENMKLQQSLNAFELDLLTKSSFRDEVLQEISKIK